MGGLSGRSGAERSGGGMSVTWGVDGHGLVCQQDPCTDTGDPEWGPDEAC